MPTFICYERKIILVQFPTKLGVFELSDIKIHMFDPPYAN